MNDIEVVNLVLGVIGTVTGIAALTVHFWRLRRESPRLKIEVLKCEHDFEEEKNTLSFWADVQIRNLGDRGTDILGIDLAFKDNGQKHNLKLDYQTPVTVDDIIKRIRPHETIETSQTAYMKYESDVREQIDCTFTIYHTHGAEKIKATSERRK